MKWFNPQPATLGTLKKHYKRLAFQHHPDAGGNIEDMKHINAEYDTLFKVLKNIHTNAAGETYTSNKHSEETPQQFRDIINAIIHFQNVSVEIIGEWLWISGSGTYSYRAEIKALNFKWSSKKSAWYFHNEPYKKKSNKTLTLDEIRDLYGVQKVNTVQLKQIAY